ncbi:lipid-A-disaccharide synthase [Synechococcus elongatus]|uniref:lipid-A-disaccharide synthase n=1 Tax=Synechococcus elongatus TaxID=32046 RepID=UPI001EE01D1A|nr:lipid-A-disaccharide synthase [Synechococcus elongatus]
MDILILSNGPGEVATWVRPVVKALRQQLGDNRDRLRLSLVLAPCSNGTGQEAAAATRYPELDRIQAVEHFWPFLLWGKTADNWDWRSQGLVIFLGGDQFFALWIARRLGYRCLIYAEWEARWTGWADAFAVMTPQVIEKAPQKDRHKFQLVGDLMAEVSAQAGSESTRSRVGLLPGSKAAKLQIGLPFMLAAAEAIAAQQPEMEFILPLAPTVQPQQIARYADADQNPVIAMFRGSSARLEEQPTGWVLTTEKGLTVRLITEFPAYAELAQCQICLTTIGANTAELGALAVPMLVLLPTQKRDAMKAWDGLPGLLVKLPLLGDAIASLINTLALRKVGLLAWPNIWAKRAIVPELIGEYYPEDIAAIALDYLQNPEKLSAMQAELRAVRGEAGAAQKLAAIAAQLLTPAAQ